MLVNEYDTAQDKQWACSSWHQQTIPAAKQPKVDE